MGNYYFSSEKEKWLYSLNSNIPYGAMYRNTLMPDGSSADENGVKVTIANNPVGNEGNASAGGASIQEALSQKQGEAIYQQKLNQCKSGYNSSNYDAEYLIEDFNQDGIKDLLLLQSYRSEDMSFPNVTTELYTVINGNLTLCDTIEGGHYSGVFAVTRKNGYVILSYSASRFSDYICSITSSLTFMQEVYYTINAHAGEDGKIYENANHIYSGYIYATDIDRGKSISMISLSKN